MKDITNGLPQVIRDHIQAHNTPDPDLLIATLAPDALLNDNRREFLGHAAIRKWAAKEIFGDKVTLDPQAAYEHHGNIIVRCNVDGTFDKSKLPNPVGTHLLFQPERRQDQSARHHPEQCDRVIGPIGRSASQGRRCENYDAENKQLFVCIVTDLTQARN